MRNFTRTIKLNRIICLVHILGSPSRHDERRGRKRQGSLSKSHPWIYFPKLEDGKKKKKKSHMNG